MYTGMSFQELKIFQLFIQTGSIKKVADYLNISPSTCTRSILTLENKVGETLLLRSNNKFHITERAFAFYQQMQPLFDQLEKINPNHAGKTTGELKLFLSIALSYVFNSYHLPLLIQQGIKPEINTITFSVSYFHLFGEYIRILLQDMDIVVLDEIYEDYLDANLWQKVHVWSSNIKLYGAQSYLEQAPKLDKPEDLIHHRCISYKNHMKNFWNWTFYDKNMQSITVPVSTDIIIDTELMHAYAVAAGWGVAQINENIIKGLKDPRIVEILPEYTMQQRNIAFYVNQAKSHPLTETIIALSKQFYTNL